MVSIKAVHSCSIIRDTRRTDAHFVMLLCIAGHVHKHCTSSVKIEMCFQQLHSQICYNSCMDRSSKNQDILLDLILNEKYHVVKYAHTINIHSVNGRGLLMDVFYFMSFILDLSVFESEHIY